MGIDLVRIVSIPKNLKINNFLLIGLEMIGLYMIGLKVIGLDRIGLEMIDSLKK